MIEFVILVVKSLQNTKNRNYESKKLIQMSLWTN